MNCLLEFRKMTFTIHFIFTFLAGIIFRPLFTTFYPCFLLSFSKKITFFMLSTWYCIRCFLSFFHLITLFSHPLQLCLHHFLNRLRHSPHFHLPRCFITFFNVFNILHVLQHKMFVEFTREKNLSSQSTSCSSLFSRSLPLL